MHAPAGCEDNELVLDREGIEPWLEGETPTLSFGVDEDLHFFPVTPQMNKPAYGPDCIAPLARRKAIRGDTDSEHLLEPREAHGAAIFPGDVERLLERL